VTPETDMVALDGGSVVLRDRRRRITRLVELEPFEISRFAVTEELAAELIAIPSAHPRRPVVGVSWQQAIRLCNALSEWEGLDPAYGYDGEDITWHIDSDGYRLPTEAEWEFACRAGSTRAQYGSVSDVAWSRADRVSHPQDVGGKMPNLFGLFDMLGNAWEWCWDLLDPADSDARTIRGGGYDDSANIDASVRRGDGPRARHDDVGFRVARGAFDGPGAQGWSAKADAISAVSDIPHGWSRVR
jgi:formylglycine-generating enzyme required for sulfatase activity